MIFIFSLHFFLQITCFDIMTLDVTAIY